MAGAALTRWGVRVGLWALILGGGMAYYQRPAVGLTLTAGLILLAPFSLLSRSWLWLSGGAALSSVAPAAVGRLLLLAAAGGGQWLGRRLGPVFWEELETAAYIALPALAAARLSGWQENRNVLAAWLGVFTLALLARRSWLAGVYLGVLVWLGSRGALLGLAAGSLVLFRPPWRALLAGLAALPLVAWAGRLDTALYRLDYWTAALNAWAGSPWFGVGTGGLWAGQVIPEPGGGWQIHAHNMAITWLAETGLVGAAIGGAGVWWLWRERPALPVAQAIAAALLAHGLVDEPLWWPGLLLVFALVLGADTVKNTLSGG